jgi:hypothetical protein
MKIYLNVTPQQLARLLAVNEFAEIAEAGGMSVEPDLELSAIDRPQNALGSTRERGMAEFIRQAEQNGLRIRRTPGRTGDVIVVAGKREWPVQVVCSESPRLSIRSQWGEPPDLVVTFVWVPATSDPVRILMLRFPELAQVLGSALNTDSYRKHNFYTTACPPSRIESLSPYINRWRVFGQE